VADRRLQVFHAVARHLSFTRAAEALFMTQPAVTFQVKQLEEQYRVRLIERGHGRIALTPAGEMVFAYAGKILALTEELEARLAEMTGEMRGSLQIGASTTLAECLLPPLLSDFNARYPQVRLRLCVANSESIASQVAAQALDIGLVDSSVPLPGLVVETCAEDELLLVCAPDHPLRAEALLAPEVLAEYEYLAREPGSGTRAATEAYFRAAGIAPETLKIQMELGSPETLLGVVATGLGYALVPRLSCVAEVESGRLVARSLTPPLKRRLALIYPEGRFRTRLVNTFALLAQQKMQECLS
jgi:DNA-binding transcriptional LysR family regulator